MALGEGVTKWVLFVYLTLQGILKCDDSACGAETKKLPLMFFRGHPVCHACQRGTMTVQVNMMLVMIMWWVVRGK